nr:hypothetical protein [Maliibacterium massiliense]
MDIAKQMAALQTRRPLFHCEADFQFALAWQLQKAYPTADIRLEYCPREHPNMHVDIMVFVHGRCYPIELKYKTLCLTHGEGDAYYAIKNHGAQDIGRYDCLKDVARIESLRGAMDGFGGGYVVILTNDPAYWSLPKYDRPTNFDAFRIHHGALKTGVCRWAERAGRGTTKGREAPVHLAGAYRIAWREYSRLPEQKNGLFQYTIIQIDPQ